MADKHDCAWCGRSGDEVKRMFNGPPLLICEVCVESMAGVTRGEDSALAAQVRDEIDDAVQTSFLGMVKNLDLGPLQDKYQRLMRVKFKEDADGATFQAVFDEFKTGVEAEVASEDFQTRYDLAIAYSEMGLMEDAYREMLASLRGALRQRSYERASEIIGALLYMHKDSERAIRGIARAIDAAGLD